MIARRIIHAVTAWWMARPTQRRIDRLRARRIELIGRIQVESRHHRRVSHHYAQLKQATTELLQLERKTTA